ncbi:molybdate ABC transporter substrate-binding protein [Paludisphaera soli]|uniref:molybdate ABC transporter substrate-binding protein n=1 Tax=Paludisphaera soli TaxID=2712865 RepID=UPI0013EB159E|nr:molybdate ABC transporter substrate-binding protein [Paludisphaera soli]
MSRGTSPASPRGLLALAILAFSLGCDASKEYVGGVEPLRIAAAADLQRVLPKLLEAYEGRDGPVVPPTFGASGNLAEQIRGGAPFDVFLSADLELPRELEGEGHVVAGSVAPYAQGSIVLLVHPEAAGTVASLGDLTRPEVRTIAIANPDAAPYGKAAREALENAGLWADLGPKIVPTASVSQALLHVERGDADAALVSRSLVAGAGSRVVEIDPALYPPRIQALGILTRSPRKDRASRFAAFLLGPEGRRILGEHGFGFPGP